jgi:superfamily II DNA helicase RecQ
MKYSIKPIAFRPELVEELGDIETAIFYQQIQYWSDKGKRDDGFIYKTIKDFEYETTLTARQQRRVRDKLVRLGYIEVKKIKANGSPTLHYKMVKWNVTKGNIPMLQKVTMESDKTSHSITESTTESTTEKPPNPLKGEEHFQTFWELYPKKVGKGGARTSYKRALKKTTAENILSALRKQSHKWKDKQFIPHPTTWLNQERWEDETEINNKNSFYEF